ALFEESYFVVFCQVYNIDHYFRSVSDSRGHFAFLLSRHFPAARRKVSRIVESPIFSACSRSESACCSGALNVISCGASGSYEIKSGLTIYSIEVTNGAPSRELSLKSA